MTKKYSLAPYYNQFYISKFSNDPYIYTYSGWINNQVTYLDLDDLDMKDDLYNIMDFHRKVDKIKNQYSIQLPVINFSLCKWITIYQLLDNQRL